MDELFTNGFAEEADRLVMRRDGDGKDLGGWCREAVLQRIDAFALAARERALEPLALVLDGTLEGMERLGTLRERLRARFSDYEVPPCRVCGRELTIQRAGGGEPTKYGCSGYEDVPGEPNRCRMMAGRSLADDHYSKSEWTAPRVPSEDVIALLDAVEAAIRALREGAPQR